MKKIIPAAIYTMLLTGFYLHQPQPFKSLLQLEGNWIMQKKNSVIGEQWKKISDVQLQCKGFMIN
jgi:hypothetical protein